MLGEQLGGVPLGTSLVALVGSGQALPGVLVFGVLLALTATTAWLSRQVALRFPASQGSASLGTPAMQPGATSRGLENMSGFLSWLPFMTVVFAAIVPLAATLYLTVTTAWTLAERVILRRVLGR